MQEKIVVALFVGKSYPAQNYVEKDETIGYMISDIYYGADRMS
jgi:hypothetical protein